MIRCACRSLEVEAIEELDPAVRGSPLPPAWRPGMTIPAPGRSEQDLAMTPKIALRGSVKRWRMISLSKWGWICLAGSRRWHISWDAEAGRWSIER